MRRWEPESLLESVALRDQICYDMSGSDTGLFRVHGLFDTPLISVVGGPISKPFDMVRVNTGRFGFMYHNP